MAENARDSDASRNRQTYRRRQERQKMQRLLRELGDIERSCDRIATASEKVRDMAEAVAYAAECLQGGIKAGRVGLPRGTFGRKSQKSSVEAPQAALATVFVIEFKAKADGRAEVCVNRTPPFFLSRALADVLGVLCRVAGSAPNEQVAWTKYSTISALASLGRCKPLSLHAISNRVYRLQKELRKRGFDPSVVERAPGLGARLAITLPPTPAASPGDAGRPWLQIGSNEAAR
jgi:hypothetical protein